MIRIFKCSCNVVFIILILIKYYQVFSAFSACADAVNIFIMYTQQSKPCISFQLSTVTVVEHFHACRSVQRSATKAGKQEKKGTDPVEAKV